jgi:hypothetical protein
VPKPEYTAVDWIVSIDETDGGNEGTDRFTMQVATTNEVSTTLVIACGKLVSKTNA